MPDLREVVSSRVLPAPKFRYSPLVRSGGFVFCSGLVALDRETGALSGDTAFEQAERILRNLRALFDEQRWSLAQIVLARIYVVDLPGRFPEVNRAWEAVFGADAPPARTSVGVVALPLGALVEMEFQVAAA